MSGTILKINIDLLVTHTRTIPIPNNKPLQNQAHLPKVQPNVLIMGGRNSSWQLTGLRQTVRGAGSPITVDTCYRKWWSEKYKTTGRGRRFSAWSWTNVCTAHRSGNSWAQSHSAVLVSWLEHVTGRRMIEEEMKTTRKTWEELKAASKDREQWKSLDLALCPSWVQRGSLTCAEVFLTSNHWQAVHQQ